MIKKNLFFGAAIALVISAPALALPPVPPSQVVGGVNPSTNLGVPLKVDASGNLSIIGSGSGGIVWGPTASGSPPAQAPVLAAGIDGTNTRTLFTDTVGRLQIIGAGASGAAQTGNPVLTAGSDGANAHTLFTDTTGRLVIVGAATNGAAFTGNPVLTAGQDGTNARAIHTDTVGNIALAGVYNSSLSSYTTGAYNPVQLSPFGSFRALVAGNGSNTKTGLPITTAFVTQDNTQTGTYPLGISPFIYNGSTQDQVVSANAANGTSGTGVQSSGNLGYDGAAWRANLIDTKGTQYIRQDSAQNSYVSSGSFTNSGGIILQIQGSGTKTVHIKSIEATISNSVGATSSLILTRRSTVSTGGTSAGAVSAPMSPSNPAATATVTMYTASPTGGTTVNAMDYGIVNKYTSTTSGTTYTWKSVSGAQDILLSGTSDFLILQDTTATSDTTYVRVVWTEE